MKYLLIIFIILFLGFSLIIFYYRKKEKFLLKNLNQMLDMAISGEFAEEKFDETMLSALESRFYQYLVKCHVSAKNLSWENEKIKELASDISHQTKTPLSNILLYAQLLNEQPLQTESLELITSLALQAEKLNFLIGSLVKTSRLEIGIVKLTVKKNDVNKMLVEVYKQIRMKAELKKISLEFIPTKEIAIYDEKWTVEAIYNIVDNAVKYTNKKGRIRVEVIAYQLFCRINIEDTGIGILEEELPRIFSRFYRSPRVNQIEGVGIGLFLARQIIASQGGYLKVSSKIGEGSIFSVFLPMENENILKV